MQSLEENLEFYRSQHRTVGCKWTHMFGVPMIGASIALFFINRSLSRKLFILGWVLQFIGHYFFEHNRPVFFEMRTPWTAASALIMAFSEWRNFLTGKGISEEPISVQAYPVEAEHV